jgi:hypothetical protein
MVETGGIHQVMWLVMLESTKDQILEVDATEQSVLSCVHYGTACLLNIGIVGSVSCSNECGLA